ncbi:MAG: hypothetical protein N2045_11045 [Fimbriimonadales bacterium]|jgi:hypothetical protein|nr:hypothetical protein [Fimbriimonadales bacterium]GBC90128.1 hypothetical protein HRbin14_00860 [bacterium HR14]CUU09177.1 hypothetical protein GBSOP10_105814 [Armatimonadetes bacterium GBS]CUU34317.1 hypothetical protein DCOP10_10724 [Armatimonadetes bacterium DC]CUU38781.1 hypothetical protein GXSOP10_14431 [Armatimonadetes bacterium GXS]
MKSKVLIFLFVGLALVVVCCGTGIYLVVRNTVSGYQEISSTGLRVVELLNRNAYASVVEMVAPSSRGNLSEPIIRQRWEIFTRAIGGARTWGVHDFNIQSFGTRQQASLRIWVRGDKGEGRVDIEFQQQGDKWWITDLKWVW